MGSFAKFLAILLTPMLFTFPQAALACVWLPITIIADTPEEEARARKQLEKEQEERKKAEQRAFRADIRSGRIDAAVQLATTLIPNVREWWEDTSDCGPGGDGDGPKMASGALVDEWLNGSEFEGLTREDLGQSARRWNELEFNRDCSIEVRTAFAARLAASLSHRQLIGDCLELCRGFSIAHFTDAFRQKRPVWKGEVWPNRMADRYPELKHEVDAFWDTREEDLRYLARLCPHALQATEPGREMFLESLRRNEVRARSLVKRANKNRLSSQP